MSRHQLKRFARDSSGAGAVEFAVAAPIFIGFLFAVLGGGWALHGVISVRYALEVASRQLSLEPTLSLKELQSSVDKQIAYLGNPKVDLTLSFETKSAELKMADVRASYAFVIAVPLYSDMQLTYSASVAVPLVHR